MWTNGASKAGRCFVIEEHARGYSPTGCGHSITAERLIETLKQLPDETPVIFKSEGDMFYSITPYAELTYIDNEETEEE